MSPPKRPSSRAVHKEKKFFSNQSPTSIDAALEYSDRIVAQITEDFNIKNPESLAFRSAYISHYVDKSDSETPKYHLLQPLVPFNSANLAELLVDKHIVSFPKTDVDDVNVLKVEDESGLTLWIPSVTNQQIYISKIYDRLSLKKTPYTVLKKMRKFNSKSLRLTPAYFKGTIETLAKNAQALDYRIQEIEKRPFALSLTYS